MNRMDRQRRVMICMRAIMLMALSALVSGCGEDTSSFVCGPSEVQACPCIGGGQSVQACAEDRQGWGQCQCESGEGEDDGADSGVSDSGVSDSGVSDSGVADSGVSDSGVADSGVSDSGVSDSGVADSGFADSGVSDSGVADSGVAAGQSVTIWTHSFNGALGPGAGLQPGQMETQGEQGFTDGGSWISMGGWLSKTISTVGYRTVEVGYLLTKDEESTCELNVSVDGGGNWTNVLSDSGLGGYRLNAVLPESAEGERRVEVRWVSVGAWCWMNDIIITAIQAD